MSTKNQAAEKAAMLLKKMSKTDKARALGVMEGLLIARNGYNTVENDNKPAA